MIEQLAHIFNQYKQVFAAIEADVPDATIPESGLPKALIGDEQEKNSEVPDFVAGLYKDGKDYEKNHYAQTAHMRPMRPDNVSSGSPDTARKDYETLKAANNWDVWGHRNEGIEEGYKQERVDGDIPRHMRVKKAHITASWHNITIAPNIQNLDKIFDQERKRMGWKDWIETYVDSAQTYGKSLNRITVDYNIHPYGQVKNVVCADGAWVRNPGAKSFLKSDHCWAVTGLSVVTDKEVREAFPDLNLDGLQTLSSDENTKDKAAHEYAHTKFYAKYETYFDDPEIERIPFTPEEEMELVDEDLALTSGKRVQARKEQNHSVHFKAKMEAVQNILSVPPETKEDYEAVIGILQSYEDNINQHMAFMRDAADLELEMRGLKQVYPHGRYVCVIGGETILDDKTPEQVPWRMLFREVSNEAMVGRDDGRGDPEIMWRESWQADVQLSRIEDLTLAGLPNVFRSIQDRLAGINTANDQNPFITKEFAVTPPEVVKFEAPSTMFELYKLSKENQQNDLGINKTSIGGDPGAGASGKLVALLQRQNQTIITGELDRNLLEALEDIVEGQLEVMKALYKQARLYYIGGKHVPVSVSELLSYQEVKNEETGQLEKSEIPKLEISVAPQSNYPDQWGIDLQFLVEMFGIIDPTTQLPIVPAEAILDHMALKYPEYGEGGKYRKVNELLLLGVQAAQQIEQERLAQEEEARRKQGIEQGVVNQLERQDVRGQVETKLGLTKVA